MRICEIFRQMASFVPPAAVRGLTKLDKELFKLDVRVPCFSVAPQCLSSVLPLVREYQLTIPGLKNVQKDSASLHSVLLDPRLLKEENRTEIVQKSKAELNLDLELTEKSLELGFDNWKHGEIFRAVFPENFRGISTFSLIGHIIHLNLDKEYLPYKQIIGEVLLEKTPTCRTVVNKLEVIDNKYRNFEMEVLAGENDFDATVVENGFTYKLDFSKVFWNPRLSSEHGRIVSQLGYKSLVYDVFAGIGPFAVPAARKKHCVVLANDLNPDCFEWLNSNIKLNKAKTVHSTHQLDGVEFIKAVVAKDLKTRLESGDLEFLPSVHAILNLPALAISFLPNFVGILEPDSPDLPIPFWVHCYSFTKFSHLRTDLKEEDYQADAEAKVRDTLSPYSLTEISSRCVRNVAANKEMMCVSFRMPMEALRREEVKNSEPEPKKIRVDC